jgi:predicted esterase
LGSAVAGPGLPPAGPAPAREHHLPVTRTARYATLGAAGPGVRQVWFVLHGFGQLARYFVRNFAALDDGQRLIVAPEALSRFYVGEVDGSGSAKARVGATWMTREDRLTEIDDYVSYLDALHQHVMKDVAAAQPAAAKIEAVGLGFSQGVATACRWAQRGRARLDRLVLWAGTVPPEIESDDDFARFRALDLTFVLGKGDPFAGPARVEELEARLRARSVPYRLIRFDGGHELDAGVLQGLAG